MLLTGTASYLSQRDSHPVSEAYLVLRKAFSHLLLCLGATVVACGGQPGQSVTPSANATPPHIGSETAPRRIDPGANRERAKLLSADAPILVGAGDVAACGRRGATYTAAILDTIPGIVFVAGDAAYADSIHSNPYVPCYDTTWGRHKRRTRATLGNHDYEVSGIDAFFNYFGAAGGTRPNGYYSFDHAGWHVIALNTNIELAHGSTEDNWLAADLAAHPTKCAVAFMHHPRFSSGPHQHHERLIPTWETLQRYGVDVVIAGHDHIYERFRPMTSDGKPDEEKGMRQFVVGTGGGGHYAIAQVEPGSEVRNATTYGVLRLALFPSRYVWDFIPIAGEEFRDHGEGRCH